MNKKLLAVKSSDEPLTDIELHNLSRNETISQDEHEMTVLGRTQELNRNFRFISILGFACTLMSTWEISLMTSFYGIFNGGPAGLVWGYLITWLGYLLVFASVAEMASMSPTSGGQYHWVAEFAPARAQKLLSYTVGWVAVLGWQVGLTSLAFLAGTMIQGLLVLNYPEYVFEQWHGTLLVVAITAFCIIFNTVLAKRLPMVEGTILCIHILGFAGVLIPLWVLAPLNNPVQVFTEFLNLGGWDSNTLSFFIGLLAPVYTLIGADSAVHMSEEVKDASLVLPKAIMWAAGVNGMMGFIMIITFSFTMGSVYDIIGSPTGYPFIQVFYNTTRSYSGASIMTAILIINITSACISTVATVSRQTWAFARDNGLPFSSFIAHVKPGWNIPLNSVLVTFTITALLSLINIGSVVAFNAIGSLAISALLSTYIISFTCLIIRRFQGPMPHHRWSLGSAGLFINLGATLFLLVVWTFIFFPISPNVTPQTMNWNSVIFGGTTILATLYYVLHGRKHYRSPRHLIKRDTI
ncbi:hypothetical protein J7T55_013043 [Diaporthe amygdali]|uniref:uncharacterized protein n=1 Tax=Phomopsis amygdali TaxID=1214568 RepID=UPI0022FEF19D|nr:uncharacterized protein J7T55_013043 [Diaporthe amygdali]KAJ0118788.1 hypothetical protein J7T55_013043 [Diaporthe amygdali]